MDFVLNFNFTDFGLRFTRMSFAPAASFKNFSASVILRGILKNHLGYLKDVKGAGRLKSLSNPVPMGFLDS
jgi:hypothetical protein